MILDIKQKRLFSTIVFNGITKQPCFEKWWSKTKRKPKAQKLVTVSY